MGHEEIVNVNSANDVITSFSGHELLHCICEEAVSAVRRISWNLEVWGYTDQFEYTKMSRSH